MLLANASATSEVFEGIQSLYVPWRRKVRYCLAIVGAKRRHQDPKCAEHNSKAEKAKSEETQNLMHLLQEQLRVIVGELSNGNAGAEDQVGSVSGDSDSNQQTR